MAHVLIALFGISAAAGATMLALVLDETLWFWLPLGLSAVTAVLSYLF